MCSVQRKFILSTILVVGKLLLTSFMVSAAPFQTGQIFVAYGGSNIGVFADTVSLAGRQIGDPISISPSTFTTGTTLSGGGGLALDEDGNLYVTVSDNGSGKLGIVKYNANGALVFQKGYTRGKDKDLPTSVEDFRSLIVRDGKIYVATDDGIRVFCANNGERLKNEDFGSGSFRDIAFDKKGNLYGLCSPAPGKVEVRKWTVGNFSGTGSPLFTQDGSGLPGNYEPRALVIDEDGYIYITVNPSGGPFVRKFNQKGDLIATYKVPSNTGTLIGLDYDPGTQRLFASHTGTSIGQILWVNRDASDGTTMTAFGPTNLLGVRWLAVYPTPEPTTSLLLVAGLLLLRRGLKRR